MRDPFRNPENSTRNASYRRFRRRRAWPVLSALALAACLAGAAALLPDRINPVEIASVEETNSENEPGGTQPEGPEPGGEPENEKSSPDNSGNGEPASGGAENPQKPRGAGREAPERGSSERGSSEREEPEGEASSGSGEGSGERAGDRSEEDREAPPPADKDMSLTVPRLGIQGDSVTNSADPQVLHEGAQKIPSTGFPWQDGANTYIAGHRIGFPGTESHNQFYDLPAMREGDPVYLTDADGETYEYRVTEIFAVSPSESWVTEPVEGRDMVTLQTCTHSPDDWWSITPQLFGAGPESGRLVVRADRV